MTVASCALSDRPRRAPTREAVEPEVYADAGSAERGTQHVPREANPAVVQGEPVDVGAAQCPGVRLLRVERRWAADAVAGPPLTPRYFGRDDFGRIWHLRDVLECELSRMHFVAKAFPEGVNLVLWRGPYIFEPDSDCDWRDPVRIENIPEGRRLHIRERCRRRAQPGLPAERTVVVDVLGEAAHVVKR